MLLKRSKYIVQSNSDFIFNKKCWSLNQMLRSFEPGDGIKHLVVYENGQYICSMWSIDGELSLIPEKNPSPEYFKAGLALIEKNQLTSFFKNAQEVLKTGLIH